VSERVLATDDALRAAKEIHGLLYDNGGQPATIATHEGALFAFTDREAVRRGPAWTGDTLAALSGPAVLDLVIERGWSALTLNADEMGGLTLPLADVTALRDRLPA
jgi:hypothetical protein